MEERNSAFISVVVMITESSIISLLQSQNKRFQNENQTKQTKFDSVSHVLISLTNLIKIREQERKWLVAYGVIQGAVWKSFICEIYLKTTFQFIVNY